MLAGMRVASLALAGLLTSALLPLAPASAAQYADTAAVERRSPALVATGGRTLAAFAVGRASELTSQLRDDAGRWGVVRSLGGRLTSSPTAASMSPGRVDVFARGGEGQLVQKYAVAGRWAGWQHLGGKLISAPSVVSWGPRRLDVFALGTDSALWHKWFDGRRWSPWERLGGRLASAPAAVAMTAGRLDVFARGRDGTLQHLYYAGSWSRFTSLGGALHSQPAAASTADGRLDVVVRGSDGALQHTSFVRGRGWSGFAPVAGALDSGPALVSVPGGGLVAGARDRGGQLLTRELPAGGQWTPWTATTGGVAGIAAAGPAAFRGLGAWVDLYDYQLSGASLQRDSALDDLRRQGVRTVYLQTSRFSVGFDMASRAAGWVDAAHARGLQVVGWYLPGYGDLARDLRRTLAIAKLRTPAGGRFDALGVDIEAHTGVGSSNEVDRPTMNRRAVDNLRDVRARTSLAVAAITPQPTATDGRGESWEGFPWQGVARYSDVVLPMSYWPSSCRDACVRDYTATNARSAASWTKLPVHMAGRGYTNRGGSPVTDRDITAFVDGALAAGVVGGSVYDYASTRTRTAWWPDQRRLNAG